MKTDKTQWALNEPLLSPQWAFTPNSMSFDANYFTYNISNNTFELIKHIQLMSHHNPFGQTKLRFYVKLNFGKSKLCKMSFLAILETPYNTFWQHFLKYIIHENWQNSMSPKWAFIEPSMSLYSLISFMSKFWGIY